MGFLKRLLCPHPSESVETHTVGIADDYGHRECTECGKEFGHWDHA